MPSSPFLTLLAQSTCALNVIQLVTDTTVHPNVGLWGWRVRGWTVTSASQKWQQRGRRWLGFGALAVWSEASTLVPWPWLEANCASSHPLSPHPDDKRKKTMWSKWDMVVGPPSSEKMYEHEFNWFWSILLATYVLYMQHFVFKHVFLEGQD